ncbi:galactosylceramidase [Longispora fulva]|uniref:galactosylceramidase n=1 Tax=Longispora fulva TaxID=619741 RepID=A0A8J7KDZ8_9ACTN|nr:RICIN domain-containing protein [Longispora fulva]MBG6134625.1 O-glycosyl hydrolase [Longispora fulva]GIG61832.1 galactosylceramidase [Longispora fulva]
MNFRNWPTLAALVALAFVTSLAAVWAPTAAQAATSITINGTAAGRVFDGVGAISGGGGNSRLLFDYPEPQRSQILDYLFKPGYGASLSILKVEVGGDTNSTDGAEPSHMHSATDENYQRGYEWWLMEQAKARNPNIKLVALSWGAPGWIGNGNFWSQDMIGYLVKWIQHAKSDHNLTIDYIGGWNERGYDKQWFINLKSGLTTAGLATKVVANDNFGFGGDVDAMVSDTAFRNAVDVVGSHYACGYLGNQTNCPSSANAVGLGKPLWASESGSQDYNTGAAAVARGVNRGYIDGKMTAFINWPIVAALYQNLYFSTDGLALADQPWSGAYSLGKTTWALAHTAQFAQPGWQYIDPATGYLGGNRANGSYVALKSPNGTDYSTVVETMDATADQTATFTIAGGLSTGAVHVWATNMRSDVAADHFVRQPDVTPAGGGYTVTLKPGYVYSLTTTTGQGKGTAVSPARAPLNLPYSDTFDGYTNNRSPKYFTDMNGSFETLGCAAGRTGTCVRQMAPKAPIRWTDEPFLYPYTMMGELDWTNYTVSSDVLLEQAGSVELLGRVGAQNKNNNGLNAYHLRVSNTGAWSIQKSDSSWTFTTLKSGTATALGTNQWHKLSLGFQGTTITAQVDGTTVGTVTDGTYSAGQVALGMSDYINAQYDNFAITPGQTTPDPKYKLINRNSGKALTVTGNSAADGALITQSTDTGATGQLWRIATTGGYSVLTNVGSGKVLDVPGFSTTAGTQLNQWTANGGANQQWTLTTSGGYTTLTNRNSSMLADVSGGSMADGAQVLQWTSNNGANQQWTLVQVP